MEIYNSHSFLVWTQSSSPLTFDRHFTVYMAFRSVLPLALPLRSNLSCGQIQTIALGIWLLKPNGFEGDIEKDQRVVFMLIASVGTPTVARIVLDWSSI